jgi:predicted hydrocarbon binding protein
MSQKGNIMKWDNETGAITLSSEGKEERAFILSQGFIGQFKEELMKTSGKSTLKMVMRKVLEKLGTPQIEGSESGWESFEMYNDSRILPVDIGGSNLPGVYSAWDGQTRKIFLDSGIEMSIWTVKSFQIFKEALADIMTEKGASALLNGAGKKAGAVVGESFTKIFGWNDLQKAFDTIDDALRNIFLTSGWGKGGAVVKKGSDGKEMILIKTVNSFESHGITSSRQVCSIMTSVINGIWSGFIAKLGNTSAETREVKCSAKGDDYCVFAIKLKDKDAAPLDWKELETEWQAIIGS